METVVLQTENAATLQSFLAWSRPDEVVSLNRCSELIAGPGNYFIATVSQQEPVGLLVAYEIQRFTGNKMFLYEIDVHPDHRRRGVGTQMIETLKQICRTRGIHQIFVLTNVSNTAAMRLYSKTGGHRTHSDDALFEYDLTGNTSGICPECGERI